MVVSLSKFEHSPLFWEVEILSLAVETHQLLGELSLLCPLLPFYCHHRHLQASTEEHFPDGPSMRSVALWAMLYSCKSMITNSVAHLLKQVLGSVSAYWTTLDVKPCWSIAADNEVCKGIQFVTWLHCCHIQPTYPASSCEPSGHRHGTRLFLQ